jgi:hypothetical protein
LTTARAIASASIWSDLPGSALAAPGGADPVGRHPHDPLTGRDQRLLEPTPDMPAVLDRPHPLVIQPARPAHRRQMARLLGLDLAGATMPPVPQSTAASAWVRLCLSAPITIICTVPFVG